MNEKTPQFLDRFSLMLSAEEMHNLMSSRILIFGVGGVGGALAQFLVRSGVGRVGIVDFDHVDITNLNRQLISFRSTMGELKVDTLSRQLKDINPDLIVDKYPIRYSAESETQVDFSAYDYIVDCVDDLPAKKLIIQRAKSEKIPLLCAMGAGNRYSEIPSFEIADIFKTSYDPIAKIIRKFCKDAAINHLNVCYTKQKYVKNVCKTVASVVYFPVNMATVMCAKIVNDILKGDING